MRKGFTLAEVLITLGVIGVVAALTMPSLITNYKKHVYYTQFMKAASQFGQAFDLYLLDKGFEKDVIVFDDDSFFYDVANNKDNFGEDMLKQFNSSIAITADNYNEICKNYEKNGWSENYNGTNKSNDLFVCESGGQYKSSVLGLITADGILYNFSQLADGLPFVIFDTNGPDKGPNAFGRDLFMLYTWFPNFKADGETINNFSVNHITYGGVWDANYFGGCSEEASLGCAAKLMKEGKMNY